MTLQDFSEINLQQELLADRGPSVNLGLEFVSASEANYKYKTGRWCGCCWLKSSDGTSDGNQFLEVECRFDEEEELKGSKESALINMISVIAEDEEFPQYLCTDLPEGERLLTFFTDEDLIPGKDIKEDNRLVVVISFLTLLERITRRFMIRHTIRRSENLTGNVRGKILFNKQVSQNLARGREDRICCQYTVKTVDTPENRFLKYALKQADAYLREKSASLYQQMHGLVLICCRRFSEVSDVRCSDTDLDRIILSGMYAAYQPVLQLAKVILAEISMTPDGKNDNSLVVPYAVNMPLLFECYARARIKKALDIVNANEENQYRAKLLPFVPDKKNMPGQEGSYLSVFAETNDPCYIRGNLVPDIVIAYRKKDQPENSEPAFYRVYDVKYKDREKAASAPREDRLQLLAYDFMYCCDESVGHIFPRQKKWVDKNKTKYNLNINSYAFVELKRCIKPENNTPKWIREKLHYLEYYLDGNAITTIDWLSEKEESGKEDSNGSH